VRYGVDALQNALLAAGAPEEKAREAAEEIAGYENRLVRIETDVALIRAELGEVHRTMATKTWVLADLRPAGWSSGAGSIATLNYT
jgi:hypothetical protein